MKSSSKTFKIKSVQHLVVWILLLIGSWCVGSYLGKQLTIPTYGSCGSSVPHSHVSDSETELGGVGGMGSASY